MSYVFAEVGQRVGALFYLAALLIVLPVFCLFCQIRNNSIKLAVAIYAMLLYYHDVDAAVTGTYPQVLLRVACGLCTGMVIYYMIKKQRKNHDGAGRIAVGSFAGSLLLTVPLVLSGLQTLDRRIALICEFVGLVLLLSGRDNHNRLTDFAAKLSMVVYILHWSVGQNINFYLPVVDIKVKLLLYYGVTIAISTMLLLVVERLRKWRGIIHDS